MPAVLLFATLDTKGLEAAYVRDLLTSWGVPVVLVDVGALGSPAVTADVSRERIFELAGTTLEAVRMTADRGQAVTKAAEGAARLTREAHARGEVSGVLALGGSAGTTIGTAAMKTLPLGVPKVMLSTLASGMVRQFVGDKDIFMLNSVVDIAGINRVSRPVLSQAARAMAGLVTRPAPVPEADDKPLVAATMFGVTTPCVERARETLERAGCEVLVFHATGNGGQAMESLIGEGLIAGVLDATTTELADEHVGGFLSAGPRSPHGGRQGGYSAGRVDGRARHGQLLRAGVSPREVQGAHLLYAQRECHVDAHDAGGERAHRCRHRAEAVRGDGPRRRSSCRRAASRRSTKKDSPSTIRLRGGFFTKRSARGCGALRSPSSTFISTIRHLQMRRRLNCWN